MRGDSADSKVKQRVYDLIHKLVSVPETELEEDALFKEISSLVPDPEWSDYVFHSNDYYYVDGNLNIEGIVEKIFSYQPIIL